MVKVWCIWLARLWQNSKVYLFLASTRSSCDIAFERCTSLLLSFAVRCSNAVNRDKHSLLEAEDCGICALRQRPEPVVARSCVMAMPGSKIGDHDPRLFLHRTAEGGLDVLVLNPLDERRAKTN